jgi:hypothetical protein
MATKTNFSPEDWTSLRTAPHLVAATMVLAGNSGITGTIGESFALAQSLYASQSSANTLMREISTPEEVKAAQEQLRTQVSVNEGPQVAYDKLHALAIQHVDKALAALAAKGTPADVADYKRWVLEIANKVANASKEGAFLGFGGERVSDREEVLLKELSIKLQTT